MKPRLLGLVHETSTAESVYAAKYEWLMRWALHFCDGNREMAEDLVQDTFVRMLSSWHSIRDIENPERFLYTYLKYGFLRLRSEDRRQAIQSVSVDDLDALERLPESGTDLLEWQRDIRAVVDFLCWRKSTTKTASLLLLRFFHGLFPAEIMQVARLTRKAVDDGLASARQEARTCTSKHPLPGDSLLAKRLRAIPQLVPQAAVSLPSTEDFMRQMSSVVFAATDGECLSTIALRDRYNEASRPAIDCWLLSHIVSCSRCLDLVLEIHSLPPRGTRPLEDVLGYAPKSESIKPKKAAPLSAAMQSMLAARERYRSSLEQRPRTVALAVDGQRIASRDVSSSQNKLTVDLRTGSIPELVEVAGDAVLMLAVPVLTIPPAASPIQHFHAELSEGRSVTLTLEFIASGMRLHMTYVDPLHLEMPATLALSAERSSLTESKTLDDDLFEEQPSISRWSRISEWLKEPFRPWFKLGVAFASACLICIALYNNLHKPVPAAVLARAVEASRQQGTGVITQRVRIASHTSHGSASYDTTLHRDLSHKLTPKHPQESPVQTEIEEELASAKIAWIDPLSPANFRDWREQQHDASDTLVETRDGLLTLTSKVPSGLVREESLTLNAQTFHAVGRMVRFRDNEDIVIAELNYDIVPLAKSDPAWFESPVSVDTTGRTGDHLSQAHALPLRASVETASPEQLDVAELNVRLAMIELRADGRERLAINRRNDEVVVEGLVATEERKQEIERRLRQVAHVRSSIRTFIDFDSSLSRGQEAQGSDGPTRITVSSAPDRESPLETLSPERHLSVDRLESVHRELLDAAVELRQSATAMRDLDSRFRHESLSDDGALLRSELMRLYAARMKSATEKETEALRELGAMSVDAETETNRPLWEVALANAQLCLELISQQSEEPRPARTILRDLGVSARAMQRSLQDVPAAS